MIEMGGTIELIWFLVVFFVIFWLLKTASRDPISRFAHACFKMKLDKKTGRFWAKPKAGFQPPCACHACEMVGCYKGNEKEGWTCVDCPDIVPKSQNKKKEEKAE